MSRVVVSGAAGYVGSRLVGSLKEDGVDVIGVVRKKRPWLEGLPQIEVDILEGLIEVPDGTDAFVHLAAPNEIQAHEEPELALATTVLGAHRVATAARENGVRRFIYLSTFHVYGKAVLAGDLITERCVPEPTAMYGASRLAAEHVIGSELSGSDTEFVCLRLTNSVGAPAHPSVERWTLVANDLCRQIAKTGQMRLRSDGSQFRDFVSLSEVCRVIGYAAEGGVAAGTYNVGSGRSISVRQLASELGEIASTKLGREVPLMAPPAPPAPPPAYTVSVDKIRSQGVSVGQSIEGDLRESLEMCLSMKEEIPDD